MCACGVSAHRGSLNKLLFPIFSVCIGLLCRAASGSKARKVIFKVHFNISLLGDQRCCVFMLLSCSASALKNPWPPRAKSQRGRSAFTPAQSVQVRLHQGREGAAGGRDQRRSCTDSTKKGPITEWKLTDADSSGSG